jgi:hypothetical protein
MSLAWLARIYLIEPQAIAHGCEPNPWQGICAPRMMLIQTFAQQGLGWLALVSAAVAALSGSRPVAWLAWSAGCLGLILYCYEFAAVGALAGLLLLLKR